MEDLEAIFCAGLVTKAPVQQKSAPQPADADSENKKPGSEVVSLFMDRKRTSSKPFSVLNIIAAPVVNTAGKLSDLEVRDRYEQKLKDQAIQVEKERKTAAEENKDVEELARKAGGKNSPLKNSRKKFANKSGSNKGLINNVLSDQQKYERSGNYVRQDLKKGKYKERYSGKAGWNRANLLPNGKRKSFYKNQMRNEDDNTLVDNGGNYEPLEEDFIGTDKMTKEQKQQHVKENHSVEVTRMAESDNSIVTKENIFFKMMNDGFKILLIDRKNIQSEMLVNFDKKTEALGRCALLEKETDPNVKIKKWIEVLHEFFSYEDFYDFQREMLIRLNNYESCMADFSTGAGKSLLFQFHSVIHEGITVVIVPMISLMIDQVKKIPESIPAICYNSWVSFSDRIKILRQLKNNTIKVLFVTPEQFISDIVWYLMIYGVRLNLLCIDEAHCSSPYSRSFRPAYALLGDYMKMISTGNYPKKLNYMFGKTDITLNEKKELDDLEEEFPDIKLKSKTDEAAKIDENIEKLKEVPILCLTATSSQEVKNSILRQFRIKPSNYMCANQYIRSNLLVTVSHETQRIKDITWLLNLPRVRGKKPLLIYCNFVKTIEGLKNYLKQCGYNARGFSSNYNDLEKMNVLQQFLRTDPHHAKPDPEDLIIDLHLKIDCIISTVSLAMGIDHRSIRGIIHYNMPSSLETYIQEIGRGGRDGKPAYCHTFLHDGDYFFQRGKCLLDHYLDRATLTKIVWFVIGSQGGYKKGGFKKSSFNNLVDFKNQKLSYIKAASTKLMLKISENEFTNILSVIRDVLRTDYNFEFHYMLGVNSSGVIKLLKPTFKEELMKDPLMKQIKRRSRERAGSYVFNVVQVANEMDVDPHYLIIALKAMAEKYQCSFFSSDKSITFTNMRHYSVSAKTREIRVDDLVEKAYAKNLELIREYCFKVDSFYILLRSQASKNISKFIDADLADHKTELMEKYVQIYFRQGATQMIRKMQEDAVCKHLPIIYLQTMRPGQKEFKPLGGVGSVMMDNSVSSSDELKDMISKLFSKERSYVLQQMAEDRSYSRVFRDFLCLISGQFSKTFDFMEWQKTEYWGTFEHYDLLECLDELEAIFKEFFKETKVKYERVEQEVPGEELLSEPAKGAVDSQTLAAGDENISIDGEGDDAEEIYEESADDEQEAMKVEPAPEVGPDYWIEGEITKPSSTKVKTV